MNLLVPGGLLVIGVLIIIALIFVIRSEPAKKVSASVAPPVPSRQEASENRAEADKSPATAQVPPTPNLNATPSSNATSSSNEQLASELWHPPANGQFYELKNELQSLHSHAQELEYRIRTLVDMFERVEQTQNGRFPIEEQTSGSAGPQALH